MSVQIEKEILGYLSDNWTADATISWANSNVTVNYMVDQDYLVPSLVLIDSQIIEVPANCGAVRWDYILGLNLLIRENTGMNAAHTYISALDTLFHKKDLSTSSFVYHFSALDVAQGFGSGPHFEIPVSIDFHVYST